MSPGAHIEIGSKSAKKVYLETFGCQMNELDSELVRGHLGALGYTFTSDDSAADVILYNTCSVREQAENKVWSRVGLMGLRKKEGAAFVLGVIGCMAEREGPTMMRRFPQVDLMCGPGELDKLPMLIDNALKTDAVERADRIALQGTNSRRSSTLSAAGDNLELLDLSRAFDPDRSASGGSGGGGRSAYVRITRGCNKFCTYCVVPYTRGAEVHRPPDAIIDECKMLADRGVIEITLLGQTVNHYTYTHGVAISAAGAELPQIGPGFQNGRAKPHSALSTQHSALLAAPSTQHSALHTTSFADLLKRIHDEVPAIQRLRFVTSFPRDFGDDILHVMAESPRICKYLHVPAQSGSNRILKLMNRGYTAEQYIEFINRARTILPCVCVAGDFIVGFPTETEEDFQLTCQLLERVRYKNSFIFKYSPRPGTVAIDRFTDDVPEDVKRRRNHELLNLQSRISAQVHAEFVGRTVDVFVEQISRVPGARKPAAAWGGSNGIDRVELRWQKSEVRGQKSEVRGQKSEVSGANSGAMLGPSHSHASAEHADGFSTHEDLACPTPSGSNNAKNSDLSTIQLSGRTEGDLIVAFELPPGANPDLLIGRIVPVQISSAAALILKGKIATRAPACDPAEAVPALATAQA